MKKKLVLMMSILLWLGMFSACSSDENCRFDENDGGNAGISAERTKSLTKLHETSWKLYGFGTDDAHIQIAEPSGCSTCYVVKFNQDGTFSGKTTSNDFYGIYSTDNQSFKIEEYETTQVGEVGDGYRFVDAFRSSVHYDIADGQLKLYNNNNDYLIFNPL